MKPSPIKLNIFLAILIALGFPDKIYSQVIPKEVLSKGTVKIKGPTHQYVFNNKEELTEYRTKIKVAFKEQQLMFPNDKTISIGNLSVVRVTKNKNRIITFGPQIGSDGWGGFDINVYSMEGRLIKEIHPRTHPIFHHLLINDDGQFICVYLINDDTLGTTSITKYDKNGNVKWEKQVAKGIPGEVTATSNFESFLISFMDGPTFSSSSSLVACTDRSVLLIKNDSIKEIINPAIYGWCKFINDETLVTYDDDGFSLFQINNLKEPICKVKFTKTRTFAKTTIFKGKTNDSFFIFHCDEQYSYFDLYDKNNCEVKEQYFFLMACPINSELLHLLIVSMIQIWNLSVKEK